MINKQFNELFENLIKAHEMNDFNAIKKAENAIAGSFYPYGKFDVKHPLCSAIRKNLLDYGYSYSDVDNDLEAFVSQFIVELCEWSDKNSFKKFETGRLCASEYIARMIFLGHKQIKKSFSNCVTNISIAVRHQKKKDGIDFFENFDRYSINQDGSIEGVDSTDSFLITTNGPKDLLITINDDCTDDYNAALMDKIFNEYQKFCHEKMVNEYSLINCEHPYRVGDTYARSFNKFCNSLSDIKELNNLKKKQLKECVIASVEFQFEKGAAV